MFGPVKDRPILSLADLEAHDPGAPSVSGERRFKCPLCTPSGRHLALNVETGAWWCHRCLAYGLIRERWRNQPGQTPLRPMRKSPQSTLTPRRAPTPPEPEKWSWREAWGDAEPIAYTPGAHYLRDRGIDEELAREAKLRYTDQFVVHDTAGREWRRDERCIWFPFRDRAGTIVAVNIRFIDVPSSDQKHKTLTLGPRNSGAVMVCDPLRRDPIVVVEGPIDALSLAMAGVPALALVGTAGTGWLPEACVLKNVALALDNDERGDLGCERLTGLLKPVGARLARWRSSAKDWNDDLQAIGPDALRARIDELYARDFITDLASPDARSDPELDDLWNMTPDDFGSDVPEPKIQGRTVIDVGSCRTCGRDDAMIDYRGPSPVCMFHKGSAD
jgi:Toprim domain-containing protein